VFRTTSPATNPRFLEKSILAADPAGGGECVSLVHRKSRGRDDDNVSNALARYSRYRLWCERVLGVHPASFQIWRQIEHWLIEHGRYAVLDDLCLDRRKWNGQPSALDESITEEFIFA
jgi:hypothetical protein